MGVDFHGQQIGVGDEVTVRLRIAEVTGDVLHLDTVVGTPAYPHGTRVNLLSGQVEKLEQELADTKPPLAPNGKEKEPPLAKEPSKGKAK